MAWQAEARNPKALVENVVHCGYRRHTVGALERNLRPIGGIHDESLKRRHRERAR